MVRGVIRHGEAPGMRWTRRVWFLSSLILASTATSVSRALRQPAARAANWPPAAGVEDPRVGREEVKPRGRDYRRSPSAHLLSPVYGDVHQFLLSRLVLRWLPRRVAVSLGGLRTVAGKIKGLMTLMTGAGPDPGERPGKASGREVDERCRPVWAQGDPSRLPPDYAVLGRATWLRSAWSCFSSPETCSPRR